MRQIEITRRTCVVVHADDAQDLAGEGLLTNKQKNRSQLSTTVLAFTLLVCLAAPRMVAGQARVELNHAFPASAEGPSPAPWPKDKAQLILNSACREVSAQLKAVRRPHLVLVLEVGSKDGEPDHVVADEIDPTRTIVRLAQWDEGRFAIAAVVACRNALFAVPELMVMAERARRKAAETVVDVKDLLPAKSVRKK